MIEFIPLASSSAGCAYLLKADGHAPLLIDAGLPFAELQKKLWAEGVNVSDLAGVLISHGHGDHAKAVPKLLAAGVDVWASHETHDSVCLHAQINLHHRAKLLLEHRDYLAMTLIAGWKVVAFPAVHDSHAFGFLLERCSCTGSLLYLTDSAYSPYRFDGLTHVCIEANYSEEKLKESVMAGRIDAEVAKRTLRTHASIERVIDMLKANDLSQAEAIYLMHLSRANSDWRDFKEQVQRATGCCVYVCAERGGIEE